MYAFDIHCNAYFPMFILLYVVQFFLSPLLLMESSSSSKASSHREAFMPVLFSNLLYVVAGSYYHYVSFLGYNGMIVT